jgi:hypothetical protein
MLCLLTDDNPNHVLCCGCRCRLSVITTCGWIMDVFVGVVCRQRREDMVLLWFGLSLSSVSKHNVVVLWMGLSVLSSIRKHNTWLWLSLSSVSKHNMWLYYGWVCRCCRPSENTIHGWGCRLSVNTTCGCIMDGFVSVVVHQRTEYMVGVVVVVCQ